VSDPCAGVQERMIDALLAHADADAPDRVHAETCADCREHRDALLALRSGLDAAPEPELSAALAERTRRRAADALLRETVPHRAPLAEGFGRELLRLLSPALLLLPLVVAWNAAVLFYFGELLAGLVPAALLSVAGAAYALAASGSVALVFGSMPFVAQREALRRIQEVTP